MSNALLYRTQWIQLGIAGLVALAVIALWPYKLDNSAPVWTDKALHIAAYVMVAFWFFQIFHEPRQRLFVFIGLIAYGVGIEFIQHFAPLRSASPADIAANACGLLIGWALCMTPLQFSLQAIESRLVKS